MTPPPIPNRMNRLPRTAAGLPIPYFVAWINGKHDFRVADGAKMPKAIKHRLCWICGQPMGRNMAFVVGPMCVVNRISSEPPSHMECAEYAVRACPFLTRPRMVRREGGLPDDRFIAGIAIERNPGVSAVYVVRQYTIFNANPGVLFDMGDPSSVGWWSQGRAATRAECLASLDSGMPILEDAAQQDGPGAVAALRAQAEVAMTLLPPEA